MYELPLFPLDTVLFPGAPLPLHIFEDRYKEMVNLCLEEQRPFGVVLIREGVAERGPLAEPYLVGCTAQITQVQPLADERMLIMAVGQERFRIVSLKRDRPYLVGMVETAPLHTEQPATLVKAADRLYPLVVDYLEILTEVSEVEFDAAQVPTDPEPLVYLAAALIQIPQETKQAFLESNRATELFRALNAVYKEQLTLLRMMPKDDQGSFSLN